MKKSSRIPTSEAAKRIAAIMHRKLSTPWCDKKEIPSFRRLIPIDLEDLALVETYYRQNWPPIGGHNALRHDLATLLNNWRGEVDRARIWCERHAPKPVRKIIPLPKPPETQLSDEERRDWEVKFEALMGRKPNL